MANVLGELFSDIADAIRDLTGESSDVKRKPTEFAEKIREVAENGSSSGSDTSGLGYALMSRDAEYTSGDETFLDVGALKDHEGIYYATIVSYAFAGFTSVTHVRTKSTLYFESNAFLGDENLKVLDVTCSERVGMIGFFPNALNGCSALESVIIRRWSEESAPIDFVSFQTGSTTGAGTFYVYVPSADYDTIVSKLPTSEVPAERFRKLEEYPAVDKWAETYTVRFWDGDTLVGEKTVKCGESASFNYAPEGQRLLRWEPSPSYVTADMDCHGVFGPLSFADASWEEISSFAKAGTAKNYYKIGDTKTFTWGSNTMTAVIAAFGVDPLGDGTGNAGITCITKGFHSVAVAHSTNASVSAEIPWSECGLRTYCNGTLYDGLPESLRNVIVPVKKYTGYSSYSTQTTTDSCWPLSRKEVNADTRGNAPIYSNIFSDNNSRIRSSTVWGLRDTDGPKSSYYVTANGTVTTGTGQATARKFLYGFCI